MRVTVYLEHRFRQSNDGRVWSQTMFAHKFWARYLEVFDHVSVVARVESVSAPPDGWKQANGPGVSFEPIPYYLGVIEYLRRRKAIRRVTTGAAKDADAILLRLSSPIAATIEPLLRRMDRPYGVEVVGDPYDVFAPGAVRHPLRPFLRYYFSRQLRRLCAGARAASYVTERTLQKRYPPAANAYSTHYSDVELPDPAFRSSAKSWDDNSNCRRLVMVGSLHQMYKGPDVAIDAIAKLIHQGIEVSMTIVGDGRHREELESRVRKLGVDKQVRFAGQLSSGEAVRHELDQADLFLIPSRTEGLPRALIEAMACALPAIGSSVGGIPELLPSEDLVPPSDADALAARVGQVLGDPMRMERMSARNLLKAREFADGALRQRRNSFYGNLRDVTAKWQQERSKS